MRTFVLTNNGNIRRIRNAFGGASAWKQHYEGGSADYYAASRRSKLIEETQAQLAAEELRDVIKNGRYLVRPEDSEQEGKKRRGGRNRNGRYNRRFETQPYDYTDGSAPSVVTSPRLVSSPAQPQKKARAPFRIVISESGKICAVPLESDVEQRQYA